MADLCQEEVGTDLKKGIRQKSANRLPVKSNKWVVASVESTDAAKPWLTNAQPGNSDCQPCR